MSDKKKAAKGDKGKRGRKKAAQATAEPPMTTAAIVGELRDVGAKLAAVANSPAGREAIAVGLSIAATVAQAAVSAGRDAGKTKPDTGAKAQPDANPAGVKSVAGQEAIVAALGGVAETMLARFFPPKKV